MKFLVVGDIIGKPGRKALKHVFITAGLTVSGILISLFGFFSGKISAIQSFAIESVFAGFILALGFYAFMEKQKEKLRPPKPPPKGTRCPVCMGFSEYKRLRKLNIKSVEDVFVKG